MRADQQLSVTMGGDCFQIACEETEVIAELEDRLGPWRVDGTGLPGFKINPPEPGNKLWVLLGSEGTVLARSTDRAAVVRSLLRQLSALAAPQQDNTMRLSAHALSSEDGVVLVDPSLLRAQAPIERMLAREGLAVVDSSFVEVPIAVGEDLAGIAATVPDAGAEDAGHLHPSEISGPIAGLMWRASPNPAEVTRAQVAHALASAAKTGTHAERIAFGVDWSESLKVRLVDPTENGSVLRCASELLSE